MSKWGSSGAYDAEIAQVGPDPNARASAPTQGGQAWADLGAAVDALRGQVEAGSPHALRMACDEVDG